MFSNNLFQSILLEPAMSHGCNKLQIVSGYASATMVTKHFEELKRNHSNVKIELIIGMAYKDGLLESTHNSFKSFQTKDFADKFKCYYLVTPPQVHSKLYIWYKDSTPKISFLGSANYTQNAFGNNQREIMGQVDPKMSLSYFNSIFSESIECLDPNAETLINLYEEEYYDSFRRRFNPELLSTEGELLDNEEESEGLIVDGLPKVKISFLSDRGELPTISGLNWGQREGRNKNQAYIRVPSIIGKTDFFPERAIHFTILTDDNKSIICTRAQDNGKAIESPHDNSRLGEYFRYRLGLANGSPVTKQDLLNYGRTDVDFYKIDEETYFMDFSKPQ